VPKPRVTSPITGRTIWISKNEHGVEESYRLPSKVVSYQRLELSRVDLVFLAYETFGTHARLLATQFTWFNSERRAVQQIKWVTFGVDGTSANIQF
jgi:hypothetical protein